MTRTPRTADAPPAPRDRRSPWRILRRIVASAVVVLIVALAILHIPAVQQATLTAATGRVGSLLGADIEAVTLRWNLFSGRIRLVGLEVKGPIAEPHSELTADTIEADLQLLALLVGRIHLKSVTVEGLGARLWMTEDGRLVLPFELPAADDPEGSTAPPSELPDVVIDDLSLQDGWLELSDLGPRKSAIEVTGIGVSSNLQLAALSSQGTVELQRVVIRAGAGQAPTLRFDGSWGLTQGDGNLELHSSAEDNELTATATAVLEDIAADLRWRLGLAVRGELRPIFDALAPKLDIGGLVTGKLSAAGHGDELNHAEIHLQANEAAAGGWHTPSMTLDGVLDAEMRARITLAGDLGTGRIVASGESTLPGLTGIEASARLDSVGLASLLAPLDPAIPIAGLLSGSLTLSAQEPTLDQMKVHTDLKITADNQRPGAFAPTAQLVADLVGGVVEVRSMRATEGSSSLDARGQYVIADGAYTVNAEASLPDLGPMLVLTGTTGGGSLDFDLEGRGSISSPNLHGSFKLRDLETAGLRIEQAELQVALDGRRYRVESGSVVAMGVTALLEADGDLPLPDVETPQLEAAVRGLFYRGHGFPDLEVQAGLGRAMWMKWRTTDGSIEGLAERHGANGDLTIVATARDLDLALAATFLPPPFHEASGRLSGAIEARVPKAGPPSGRLSLETLDIALHDHSITTSQSVSVLVERQELEVAGFELITNDGSRLAIDGRVGITDGAGSAALELSVPELQAWADLAPVGGLSGSLGIAITGQGSWRDPVLRGRAEARDLSYADLQAGGIDVVFLPEENLSAEIAVSGLTVKQRPLADSRARLQLEGDALHVLGHLFDGQLAVSLQSSSAAPTGVTGTISLSDLNVGDFAAFIDLEDRLAGTLNGTCRFEGRLDEPSTITAELELDRLDLTSMGWTLTGNGIQKLKLDGGLLTIGRLDMSGPGLEVTAEGTLPVDDRQTVDGGSWLEINAELIGDGLLPLLEPLDRLEGRILADVRVKNSLTAPRIVGAVRAENVALDGPDLPAPLERLNGAVLFDDKGARLEALKARFAGGTLELTGGVQTLGESTPSVDLALRARNVELEHRAEIVVHGDTDLALTGVWPELTAGGEIRIDEALYTPRIDIFGILSRLVAAGPIIEETGELDSGSGPRIALDLQVNAPQSLEVDGSFVGLEMGAQLQIAGALDSPEILGNVTVHSGSLEVFQNQFEITTGLIQFTDPLVLDPELDIVAVTSRDDEEILMTISGRASDPHLSLSSTSGRSQTEIVNLLLGRPEGSGSDLAFTEMAMQLAVANLARTLAGHLSLWSDLVILPFPMTPEGEEFLFSAAAELAGPLTVIYYKASRAEEADAFEMIYDVSRRTDIRARQNQDGSLSAGFRLRWEFH